MKLFHTNKRAIIKQIIASVSACALLLTSINLSVFASDAHLSIRDSVLPENDNMISDITPKSADDCYVDPVTHRAFGYISTDEEVTESSIIPVRARNMIMSLIPNFPTSVDNSTSIYFPEIGDQGDVGACASFAAIYYQYTFELNKRDHVATTPDNTCCPQFTYSLVNYGTDWGSSFIENYNILAKYGCLRYGDYNPSDIDTATEFFQFWNGNEAARIEAIKDKGVYHSATLTGSDVLVTFGGNNDYALMGMKQLLKDGRLLTIGCNFNYDSILTSEEGTNPGEEIIIRGNNNGNYGHALTIVGFDDDVCADVNGDGEIEPAERGAFKIANSWGDEWGNDGFIWLLYDACNRVSQNTSESWENSFETTRKGFIDQNKFYFLDAERRDAKLIGVVDMTTLDRYKTRVSYYSYDEDGHGTSFKYYVWPYSGNPILPFNGSLVFCLDSELSVIPGFPGSPFGIVIGTDNIGPYVTTYNNVKIIDDLGNVVANETDNDTFIDVYNVVGNEYTRDVDFTLNLELGDLNYDTKINPIDSNMLTGYLAGARAFSSLQIFLADINRDGNVNLIDKNLLISLMLG